MVICHKYKYLFIEIPHTGSWTIQQELCEFYDGQKILHKHANYPEFLKVATHREEKYFTFATIRNPLDEAVSAFYKLKTDHKGIFSDAKDSLLSDVLDYADIKAFEMIGGNDVTFEQVFLQRKIWERPFSSMLDVSSNYIDFVIKFENLEDDFSKVLDRLGIQKLRNLPIKNKTAERDANWSSYYTPKMREKAKNIYGPFMQKWGYQFPAEWGPYQVSFIKRLEFQIVTVLKRFYLINFRYNQNHYAKVVRVLNAHIKKFVR